MMLQVLVQLHFSTVFALGISLFELIIFEIIQVFDRQYVITDMVAPVFSFFSSYCCCYSLLSFSSIS